MLLTRRSLHPAPQGRSNLERKLVIHSLSKYIAGHNDILGGVLITKNQELHERFFFLNRTLGAILSPDECYRILQEVKTTPAPLEARWQRNGPGSRSAGFPKKRRSGGSCIRVCPRILGTISPLVKPKGASEPSYHSRTL